MAKTNIERFDEMSAAILAFLYDRFPSSEAVSPAVAGLSVVEYGPYDPEIRAYRVVSGERDPETEFFNSTLSWLTRAEIVDITPGGNRSDKYTLTAKTLKALRQASGGSTFGSKLSEAVKADDMEAAAVILGRALTE